MISSLEVQFNNIRPHTQALRTIIKREFIVLAKTNVVITINYFIFHSSLQNDFYLSIFRLKSSFIFVKGKHSKAPCLVTLQLQHQPRHIVTKQYRDSQD